MAKIIRAKRAKQMPAVPKKAGKEGRQRRRQSRRRKPAAKKSPKPKPWTPAEVHEAFSRFRKANPGAEGRARAPQPLHAAGRGGAVGAGDRCRRQQGDARAVRGRRHAAKDAGARRGHGARLHQDHRALSQQGQERHRAVGEADRANSAARCRAPAPSSRRCPASAARPPMSCSTWRSASTPWRSTRTCSASATAPGLAPGKTPLEVELGLREGHPVRIHAARPSLADPARPLHLPGAQAALRGVPDQRSLPLAGEDGVRCVISVAVIAERDRDSARSGMTRDMPRHRGSLAIARIAARSQCSRP